ncbi:MAG: DNA polymerase I [Kiritimatiellaeota bacterium]|nr:DNA polymerase I [Kiritimatiellota bacterium]
MPNTLYLLDGHAQIHRAFHAQEGLATPDGRPTGAIFGFFRMLLQLEHRRRPDYWAAVFDAPGPTFRHREYPEYKATRKPAPPELRSQVGPVQRLTALYGLPVFCPEGFEADDGLGTLARQGAEAGLDVYVVTGDKDCGQLLDARIRLYDPYKDKVTDEAAFREARGIAPAQLPDLMGLWGDASDNIPGVSGVGDKTAQKLLAKYGTLENILARTSEIPGKLGENLASNAAVARMCRALAEIRADVPLGVEPAALARQPADDDAANAFFAKYEMFAIGARLLGKEIKKTDAPQPAQTQELPGAVENAADGFKRLADVPHDYAIAQTPNEMDALVARLATCHRWAFDTETTGVDPWKAELVGMSFATEPGRAWYVPVPPGATELLKRFAPVFADEAIEKIGQNIKFDMTVLRRHGIEVAGPLQDTLLEHYALDAADRHGMDYMARQRLQYDPIPIEAVIGKGKEAITMRDAPLEKVAEYAAEDADVTLRLHDALWPEVKAAGCAGVLAQSEVPLARVLMDMEEEGVRVDLRVLDACRAELDAELAGLERRIQEVAKSSGFVTEEEGDLFSAAGVSGFNINSPRQVGELLFGHLKLAQNPKRTPTGQYATDEDTLQLFAGKHEVVDLILEHRVCAKLKNTYVDKLPGCVNPRTGRVHTQFTQAMTSTGRLASSDPNLQNIPIRTPRGRRLRGAFVARDGDHLLLCADYSQIELRVMASMSGDEAMMAAFQNNADIHAETAARVNNIDPQFVTPDMRSAAKMVNFGIIYGISAFGLAQRLGVPQRDAAQLIEAYFKLYPRVKAHMEESIARARERGYAVTLLGRRCALRDLDSRNAPARQAAERNAINTPIQGTAADLIKLAMVRVHRELKEGGFKAKMILQVHDELLFDVPRDEVGRVTPLVRDAMAGVMKLNVPIVVDIGIAPSWLEAH